MYRFTSLWWGGTGRDVDARQAAAYVTSCMGARDNVSARGHWSRVCLVSIRTDTIPLVIASASLEKRNAPSHRASQWNSPSSVDFGLICTPSLSGWKRAPPTPSSTLLTKTIITRCSSPTLRVKKKALSTHEKGRVDLFY